MLYGRLDRLRDRAAQRLAGQLRSVGGTQQARSQRDSTIAMYAEQVEQYGAVEDGLCFGRLDVDEGPPRYIGRIGIFDEDGEYEPLLIDWRAPVARSFYLATAASPDGVRRRRHIRTRFRKVTGINDEVLDLAAARRTEHEGLTGEAALLAAVTASRTGRMGDIVQTIQAEQDRVIRADLPGVLVVQGGPGTGKTAVALHRAAYLLYTHRQQALHPGRAGGRPERHLPALHLAGPADAGRNRRAAAYGRRAVPRRHRDPARTGGGGRDQGPTGDDRVARRGGPRPPAGARGRPGRAGRAGHPAPGPADRAGRPGRARRSGRPHNLAQPLFDIEIIHALARQVAERIGTDPLGGENLLEEADLAEIRRELRDESGVQDALAELWPVLTPQQLLSDLLGSAGRIAAAGAELVGDGLTEAELDLLHRDPDGGFTPADVPLLDECAELLGEDDRSAQALAERERRQLIEYAEGALEIALGSRSIDTEDEAEGGEILSVTDLLGADELAERQETGDRLTTAQRAAADRKWAFGHIIVDEAQELSPMAWRLLMRRCPSRSMTVVGDVAQTGALGGAASWRQVLGPYVADRWRVRELSVSYRTPAEIMAVAGRVLAEIDPTMEPPRAVRSTGLPPWDVRVAPADLAARLVECTLAEAGAVDDGRLGVIVPEGLAAELGRVVTDAVPEAAIGEHPELESRVVVLTVPQAKGLEFDSVLVVEPDRIVAESPRGHSDLYVALTRATQRLGVLRTTGAALG